MTELARLFATPRPRRRRRVMMHVVDAGNGPGGKVIKFGCVCGHNTGWISDQQTVAQNKRGMPCPPCNQEKG